MNKFKFLLYVLVTFIVIQKCFAVLAEAVFLNDQNLTDNSTGFGLDNQNTLVFHAPFKLGTHYQNSTLAVEQTEFEKLQKIGKKTVKIVNEYIIHSNTRMIMEGTYSDKEIFEVGYIINYIRDLTSFSDAETMKRLEPLEVLHRYEQRASLSLFYNVGNCAEMALAGGYLMKQMGVETQIDLVYHYTNHAFLKVHSTPVLYVDPWGKRIFTEDKFHQNLREIVRQDYDKTKPLEKLYTFEKPKSPLWQSMVKL